MLILAGLYASGRGTAKDNVKAYKWAYVVASASKVDGFRNGARRLLGVLETRMTADETSLSKTNAASWHATPAAGQVRPDVAAVPSNPAPPATTSGPVAATNSSQPPAVQAQPSPSAILPSSVLKSVRRDGVDNLLEQVPQGPAQALQFLRSNRP
jgi:TPR repeat protein